MTGAKETGRAETPGFTGKRDPLHDWAMELADLSRRLDGARDPRGRPQVTEIAAQMEERAAEQQPAENHKWKTVLYRSAGWLHLNAAGYWKELDWLDSEEKLQALAEKALQCAQRGEETGNGFIKNELEDLRSAAEALKGEVNIAREKA